jgi:hypothetical protein
MFGEGVTDPQQVHKAASALRKAIAADPDDFAHPEHENLVAFAEGRLSDVDRELVQTHVDLCAQCAEDVRDVSELRDQMAAPMTLRKTGNGWKYLVGAATVAAAALILAIALREEAPAPVTNQAVVTPASPASPRDSALSSSEQTAVDYALASGRVDVPASVRALRGSTGRLLGSPAQSADLLPMSPSGTFVESAAPQFSWRPIAGAVSYSVAVFDSAFRQVASSSALTTASWTPTVQLPRNVPLAWQVTARMSDGTDVLAPAPPHPEARFTVVDPPTASLIADLRSRLADQPLALGILLAKAGLVDQAAKEFTRAAADPSLAEIAAKLRESLKQK